MFFKLKQKNLVGALIKYLFTNSCLLFIISFIERISIHTFNVLLSHKTKQPKTNFESHLKKLCQHNFMCRRDYIAN